MTLILTSLKKYSTSDSFSKEHVGYLFFWESQGAYTQGYVLISLILVVTPATSLNLHCPLQVEVDVGKVMEMLAAEIERRESHPGESSLAWTVY